jgi:hypothetical protein
LARKGKGKEAKLSYNGNLLVENRNGLIVNTEVFEANGTAERDAALVMLEQILLRSVVFHGLTLAMPEQFSSHRIQSARYVATARSMGVSAPIPKPFQHTSLATYSPLFGQESFN